MVEPMYGVVQAVAEIKQRWGDDISERNVRYWIEKGLLPDVQRPGGRAYAIPESSLKEIVRLHRKHGS